MAKSLVILTISILFSSISFGASTLEHSPQIYQDQKSGVSYHYDNFGNIWPSIANLAGEALTTTLKSFVISLQNSDQGRGKAFLLNLSLTEFGKSEAIKEAGFVLHHASTESMQWKIQNGSPMPDPMTSIAGARVIIVKEGKILVVEDKNLPNRLMLPGGSYDKGELLHNTAIREIKEEVSLSIDPNNCRLLAIMNRVNANRYGANDMSFYFLAENFTGEITPDPREITWASWVNLDDILKEKGHKLTDDKCLKASPITLEILQHVKNGAKQSYDKKVVPDLRQSWKPMAQQDPQDVMHLYLLAQPPFESRPLKL